MLVGEVFARMGLDSKQYEKDLSRLEGVTTREATTLGAVFKNAFSVALGMGVFEAVKRGFRAVVGESISFNAQMEQARIGFTTMLGSAERADKFLRDVADFAARTPFEFPELLDASKRMLAYGFAAGDVLPMMEAVGNATAALGLGAQGIDRIILALGQMRAKGKLSGEEMRQLTEAGIPAWEMLAEAMGKTTAEIMDMQSKGLIPADRAIKMLVEGMNKRFPDMMKNMENTWEGVTSTIKDVWSMTLGEMTKGLFGNATEWLKGIRDTMQGFYDALKAGGLQYAIQQTFGAGVAASVGTLVSALKGLWNTVVGVSRTIVANWTLIRNLTLGVVWAFLTFQTVFGVLSLAETLTKNLKNAVMFLSGEMQVSAVSAAFLKRVVTIYNASIAASSGVTWTFSGALLVLRTAIHAVWAALGPVGWAILAISAALGVGVSFWSKYNQAVQASAQKIQAAKMAEQQKAYAESAYEAAEGTDTQAEALANLGKVAGKNLQSFDEFHELTKDTGDTDFGDLLSGEALAVPGMPDMEMPDFDFSFDDAIAQAKADMGGFWGWLKDGWSNVATWAGNLWDGVKDKWNVFRAWILGWAGPLWDGVKEKWLAFATWAGSVWDLVKANWTIFKDWVLGWAGPLWDWVKERWSTFATWAMGLWDGIKAAWGTFATWCGNLWDGVKTKWTEFKDWVGRTWDGIVDKFGSLKDTLYKHIVEPFQKAKDYVLGIIDSAKAWGKNLVTNFVDGIKSIPGKLVDGLASVGNTVKNWIGFESPTKEGPGRYADEWAPNLMKMYSEGILANVNRVQAAAGAVAQSLAPMTTQPMMDLSVGSSSLKDSILEALMQKEIVVGGSGSQEIAITLKLENGEVLADLLIDPINRTAKSRGYAPVFKPAN